MSEKETTTGHEHVLESIAALKNESNWDLNAQKLTDGDIRVLAKELQSNKNCGVLHLHLNSIIDRGVEVLCQALTHHNRTLKVVDITFNRITGEGVNMILDLFKVNDKLMGFMLADNPISKESKDKLREVAKVRNVSLGVNF
jgi:Ran GTPase-activating protein (RanGAP) involved in mRNA processing and transport